MTTKIYVALRKIVRGIIKAIPAVDQLIGPQLVALDIALRKHGVFDLSPPNPIPFGRFSVCYGEHDRALAESILTTGSYEPETLDALRTFLPPGGTFVDVGANIGLLSLIAADAVGPHENVLAFEPSPSTRAYLEENLRRNGFSDRSNIEGIAITDRVGSSQFVLSLSSQFNAIDLDTGSDTTTLLVDTTSLDHYFRDRGWPQVDVVKLNIEGHEIPAVRGMRELIERNPDLLLIVKYHLGVLARAGTTGTEFVFALRDVGFRRFNAQVKGTPELDVPKEISRLDRLGRRQNVNLLCRR